MSNVQKFREMLVAFPNSPYICSAHLQIEGVSGLDRLDAASSPAFLGRFKSKTLLAAFLSLFFQLLFRIFFRKVEGRQQIIAHILSPPFRPTQAEGGFFLPFCQPFDIGTRLAKKKAYGARPTPPQERRPPNAARQHKSARHAAHSIIIYSNKNKKATYHYGKDYRN